MRQKTETLAEEQAAAALDRKEALHPNLARTGLRPALIAAADKTPWHKFAYKIHNKARQMRA